MQSETLNVELSREEIYVILRNLVVEQKHWETLISLGLGQMVGPLSKRKIRFRFGSLDRKPLAEVWEMYNGIK